MAHPLRTPALAPAPSRRPLALAAPVFTAVIPCGCEDGMVTAYEPGTATFYSEGREVWVCCPDCGGNGSHEVRGTPNGKRWADVYPDLAGLGGFLVVRLTADDTKVGWCPTVEAAKAWRTSDWDAGREDAALLDALGLGWEVRHAR